MHSEGCGNTFGQICHAKGSRIEVNVQDFM
jgi:hypothetical protein